MALEEPRKSEKLVENCIKRYLFDPADTNIFSTISRAFIECYLESKVENYISIFTRKVSSILRNTYSCSRLKCLFQQISRRLDEISYNLSRRGFVYEYRLTTVTRLIIHSRGGRLPFEVTLAWDPILNLPFTPSSSIKGAARAYFEESNIIINNYSVQELFGYEKERGLIEFLDAYPVNCRDSLLEPDVITPHYSEVAGSIDEASSAPIPIVFTTVAPGTSFRLILLIDKEIDLATADEISKKIAQALSKGIGAKTTLGYGRCFIQTTRI